MEILRFEKITSDTRDVQLHDDVPELLACAEQCPLCKYICSLCEVSQFQEAVDYREPSVQDETTIGLHDMSQPPSTGVRIVQTEGVCFIRTHQDDCMKNTRTLIVLLYHGRSRPYMANFTVYSSSGQPA